MLNVLELQLQLEGKNGYQAAAERSSILRDWQQSEAVWHATREMGSQGLKGIESRRHLGPITQGIWEDISSRRDSPVGQELEL